MSGTRAWRAMIATEGKLVWRDPAGVFLPMGLPLLMIAMHAFQPEGRDVIPGTGGLTAIDVIAMPTGLVLILAILGLVNVPSFLATYRQQGVLRRLSVTPAHPSMVLAAQVIVNLILGVIGITIGFVVAASTFGVGVPNALIWAVVCAVLAAASLYGVGLVIAAIAPSSNSGMAIGLVVFLLTMAVGGGMLPAENLPPALVTVGDYTPFGAAVQSLRAAWLGDPPATLHLTVMAVTAVVSGLLATRLFRWQ